AGEWHVDESLERMIPAGEVEPVIVVGIENGRGARTQEYTPWPDASRDNRGGGADAFLAAIRDTLKPEIDRRYRTLADADHTWMAGSSLGGLLSAYAAYHYAETFGRVACVSPSLWWNDHQLLREARKLGRPRVTRWYQDMGTIEEGATYDQDRDGVDDHI